ncbi:MAG: protocatechuate 3,4-dioxygenase [Planctomycetota bacterium]|jgi:protocatechuate 3,4-dioxygenase beta subunit|nr:protocatechuate 3,4-dioxygenase [Planctomycetota bacterium]MDP6504700.1 protocatechuate 3,4-dioxygenase [Planctomycetota bacterium]
MTKESRREFLAHCSALGLSITGLEQMLEAACVKTPKQTPGPFYPVPSISKQQYNDTDLTRKLGKDEVAKGEIIRVKGQVKDEGRRPVKGAVVEVWQEGTSGRYNHPRDDNRAPLDEDFQFWGRAITGPEGQYEFLTIKPGRYRGRSPHIHYSIQARNQRPLVTQMYFADEGRENARDGIYRRLSGQGREAVTVGFSKQNDVKVGTFDIVLPRAG